MKRRRYAFLAVVALAAAAISLALAGSARSDTTGSTAPVKTLPTYFRDKSGDPILAIHIQPGRFDTGQFAFYVAGQGQYVGTIPLTVESQQVERLSGTVAAQLYPVTDSAPTPASLRMEGIIDPTDLTANVNVWVGSTHYQVHTDHGLADDAVHFVSQLLPVLQREDWNALYPLLMGDIQKQHTQAEFVQQMTAQAATGPIIMSMIAGGAGKEITSRYGYTYYQQPITVQVQEPDGTPRTISSNLYLVRESETWRFWGTDKAPAS